MEEQQEIDYQEILLKLIASLTLCDHMGDVSNEIIDVLEKIGFTYENDGEEEFECLQKALHFRGITTLNGTEIWSEED
jgi:hypothetical protein